MGPLAEAELFHLVLDALFSRHFGLALSQTPFTYQLTPTILRHTPLVGVGVFPPVALVLVHPVRLYLAPYLVPTRQNRPTISFLFQLTFYHAVGILVFIDRVVQVEIGVLSCALATFLNLTVPRTANFLFQLSPLTVRVFLCSSQANH